MTDENARHGIRIAYDCGEKHPDGRDFTTYVAWVPVGQPWKTGQPWTLAIRDAVYEAADILVRSLGEDIQQRPK